ncbi:hypothetical protein WA577_004325 [Blastocystis sp. JDR]
MSAIPKATRYVATVVSTKMQKSCVVVVEKMWKWNSHIKKNIATRKRMIVHDEKNEAVIGDKVLIEAVGRKLSAHKTFTIKEIVKRASLEKEFYEHLNSPIASQVAKEVASKL